MTNPSGTPLQHSSAVILYGLAEPVEAEREAMTLAIAEARDEASRIVKSLEKRIGAVRHVDLMQLHIPAEFTRRNKTPLLSRGTYLSVSPEYVEIPARVSVNFELLD